MTYKDPKKQKEFQEKYHKKRLVENPDYNKDKHNKRKDKDYYKKAHKKATSNWDKNNPEKKKAQQIAQKNIPFPKNKLCEKCNLRLATHRHHPDYSKPLKVFFVCNKCHREIHNGR